MRFFFIYLYIACLLPCRILAQYAKPDSLKPAKTDSSAAWSFYAEGDYYIFPTDLNIFMITATANRKLLHLEARYNYEERNTASVFGGLNFSFGNELHLMLTPIVGLIFGRLNGLAPGLETELSYKIFEFNSQSEYVFDFSGKENDFAYTYLQLGASLLKNFSMGLAAQRTQLYKTSLDLQRGVYAGYSFHKLNAVFTWFNPITDSYFFICTLSVNF